MTLKRLTGSRPPAWLTLDLLGIRRSFTVEEIQRGVQQGDAVIETLADDFGAVVTYAGAPLTFGEAALRFGPEWDAPRSGDMVDDWQVTGSEPVYVGPALLGYRLRVRGGTL